MPKRPEPPSPLLHALLGEVYYLAHPEEFHDELPDGLDYFTHLVLHCRYLGATWRQIGHATGVSAQAAWKRYHDLPPQAEPPQEPWQ